MNISAEILDLYLFGKIKRNVDEYLGVHYDVLKGTGSTTVPREVCMLLSTIPGSLFGVFCAISIKKGSKMGPLQGTVVPRYKWISVQMETSWEILERNGSIFGYLNVADCTHNWLMYVQCARTEFEQNLEVVQIGNQIYYRAIKDIQRGEELLVWYGAFYTLYMGVPYTINRHQRYFSSPVPDNADVDRNPLTEHEQRQVSLASRWRCALCQRGFNSHSNLRSHMRTHTLEKPFACKFCGRNFSQSSTLRNHVRLHTGEKPYKCKLCKSSYSQLAGLRAHQRSSTHNTGNKDHMPSSIASLNRSTRISTHQQSTET